MDRRIYDSIAQACESFPNNRVFHTYAGDAMLKVYVRVDEHGIMWILDCEPANNSPFFWREMEQR